MTRFFGKSTPRVLRALLCRYHAARAELSMGKGMPCSSSLSIAVPCKSKPVIPSCAWGCGQVMLRVVPEGKRGGKRLDKVSLSPTPQ